MYKQIMTHAQERMRREALENRASIIGRVSAVYPGKLYDVTTTDGKTYRKVGIGIPAHKFDVGTWVTMEWSSIDWQIVAYSGEVASDE